MFITPSLWQIKILGCKKLAELPDCLSVCCVGEGGGDHDEQVDGAGATDLRPRVHQVPVVVGIPGQRRVGSGPDP